MRGVVPGPNGIRIYPPSLAASLPPPIPCSCLLSPLHLSLPPSIPFPFLPPPFPFLNDMTGAAPGAWDPCLLTLPTPFGKSCCAACPPWRLHSDATHSQKPALTSTVSLPFPPRAPPSQSPCQPLFGSYHFLPWITAICVHGLSRCQTERQRGLVERAWTLEPYDLALNPSPAA